MAAAITRGRALGVSASQAVSDVITGIGRMSPQILDNLGIVGVASAFDDYAASLGKTAEQLTEVEKKQALVNTVIASSGGGAAVIDDAAAAFERMDASLQNAKEALGVLFSPAIAAIAEQIAAAATGATDALNVNGISATTNLLAEYQARLDDILDQLAVLERNREVLATQPAFAAPELQSVTPGDIDALREQAIVTAQLIYQTQLQLAALQGVAQKTALTRDEQYAYNQSLWAGQAAWSAFRTEAQIAQDAVLASRDQIMASAQGQLESIAREIANVQGADAGLEWLERSNQILDEQITKWAETGRTVEDIGSILLATWLGNLAKVASESNKTATEVAGIGKGAQIADGALARSSARMMQNLAKVGAAGRRAATDVASIGSSWERAIERGRGGGLGEGFRRADYEPVLKTTDATTALDLALTDLMDTAYSGGGGGGIGGIADEFDSLQSSVQSVIDSATGMDIGGLNPADFLPREDAINENARRLAAIMRDGLGNQEWMEEFKAEVPALWEELSTSSDPKAAAARMLQEFQAGMRPELLDKEMIKDRVRQMILGDQSSAQLAQEIAGELAAELNISLGQAQQAVAGAMGVGGTGALPAGTKAGPDGATEAQGFVGAWVGVVTGMVDQFDASGKTTGTAFSAGFMSTQPALLDAWASALVGKLIPAVVAALAAQGSRTGAQ
jgi:hypothetical protein